MRYTRYTRFIKEVIVDKGGGKSSASGRSSAPELATRDERKLRTRSSLLDAALTLMQQGRSFTSLGLREITREAGVVPTSFYRHFRDMDELGLALVDDGGATLRSLLREARKESAPVSDIIRRSVTIYKEFLLDRHMHFMFIAGERSGGSPVIRSAIRNQVNLFVLEMSQDLRRLNFLPHLSTATLQMLCGLVVNTMLNAASDILDMPPDEPTLEQELLDNFVKQLRLIFLGAISWKEPVAKP
ncbi:HTH-type transcriptional repressor FabR [Stenotrophobium rhamnosiphilum]|uniref:HTH-type transcriptional repressor FabR n=1 Tax=Stenotrophobium rhamnosiphilum TaxID=2029166 RepID=A0A2T5MFK9_9GAMM|nr:HTH-type transcriptional repressor FabR [Stenotrophobium rhamnosiphilum]PTU31363.1 HTH-type transcriptional repressor FabR [Stenotrophobium rhamnosiphilum]